MIVIAIILVLFSIALFPYGYYMQRSYVENTIDTVGQEWILAQKEIRNGKMFDATKHANAVIIFRKGSEEIEQYMLSWTVLPPLSEFSQNTSNPNIKTSKIIQFENNIEVLDFTGGSINATDSVLGYYIEAPFASGAFFTDSNKGFYSSWIYLIVWYTGSNLDEGLARKILLKPYLQ